MKNAFKQQLQGKGVNSLGQVQVLADLQSSDESSRALFSSQQPKTRASKQGRAKSAGKKKTLSTSPKIKDPSTAQCKTQRTHRTPGAQGAQTMNNH